MDGVIWAVECDAVGFSQKVCASSHAEMVQALLARGFKRLIKADEPYQDEPLAWVDARGRLWDAMPFVVPCVQSMKPIAEIAKDFAGAGGP